MKRIYSYHTLSHFFLFSSNSVSFKCTLLLLMEIYIYSIELKRKYTITYKLKDKYTIYIFLPLGVRLITHFIIVIVIITCCQTIMICKKYHFPYSYCKIYWLFFNLNSPVKQVDISHFGKKASKRCLENITLIIKCLSTPLHKLKYLARSYSICGTL